MSTPRRPDRRRREGPGPDPRVGSGRSSDRRRRTASSARDGRGPTPDARSRARRGGARPSRRALTAAEQRAAEVRARGGGVGPKKPAAPPARTTERWIDEGAIRSAAQSAARRAVEAPTTGSPPRRRASRPSPLEPAIRQAIEQAVGTRRAERVGARLVDAMVALDAERFAEARRLASDLLPELATVAAVHEVVGLASYRMGRWKEAARALETARTLGGRVDDLPVLADCYRALRRYERVDEIWAELRAISPSPAVMAEGRIVAAGARADQGDLVGAIRVMGTAGRPPRRVREHHLRLWYVLADLHDRSGDAIAARELFRRVAGHDPDFADVAERLAALGG